MKRAKHALAGLLLTLPVFGTMAAEERYPSRPIRLIAPFAPGGPSDMLARLLSAKLNEGVGQSVIVDNRPSAGGVIGMELVAKSNPDGYTILLGASGALTMNPSLYEKLPYDAERDFQPITQLTTGPNVLVVHPSVGANSVQELIALAKAKPGHINFASAGTGNRIAGELFKREAAIDIVNVPYKGTGPALTGVIAGQVQMMFASPLPVLPQVKAGKLRALAVTSSKRSAIMPELPTVAESGLPGFEVTSWHGVLVPAKTPKRISAFLHSHIVNAWKQPDVKERLMSQGLEPIGSTPEQFAAYIRTEKAKNERLIKQLGIKAD